MFLDDVSLKTVFGDGGIAALGAVIEVLSGVSPDMHVVMYLVPK